MLGDAFIILLFATKHAKGMSLRYDAPAYCGFHKSSHLRGQKEFGYLLFAFSDKLIS